MTDDPLSAGAKAAEATAKAAEQLFGVFRDCINVYSEPARIKKNAEAEAQAIEIISDAKLKTEGKELVQRSILRFMEEQMYKQKNLETIVSGAAKLLDAGAKPTDITKEWLHRFSASCQDTSQEELQNIWSQVLAQEGNEPGSVSYRTLELVKLLSRNDAQLIEDLSKYVFSSKNASFIVRTEASWEELKKIVGISYGDFKHLESIGIVSFDDNTVYSLPPNNTENVRCCGQVIIVSNNSDANIQIRAIPLTQVGNELMRLFDPSVNQEYINKTKEYLVEVGYEAVDQVD